MKLTERELELINSVSFTKEELFRLTDLLSDLIGYDSEVEDIDSIGLEADNIISKILIALEKRGEL